MAPSTIWSLLIYIIIIIESIAQSDYFLDEIVDYSNIKGGITDPDKSTKYIQYLGTRPSKESCISSCVSAGTNNNKCESFTYISNNYYNNTYRQHCYGLFGRQYGSIWTPIPDKGAITGRLIYPCLSDLDCSLNGVCDINTKNCSCNFGWTGYHCGQIQFDIATKGSGYVYINNISTWGGSVIYMNDTNTYHMYLAQFDNHCGVDAWVPNSKIVHAISSNGFNSRYIAHDVVHPHFSHEPDIKFGPNGELVIYYIAANVSSPECVCSDGSTPPNSCKVPGIGFTQIMQYATNPNGPWSNPGTVIDLSGLDDPNLSGVILKNGSYVGLGRNWISGHSTVYLITSNDWKDGKAYKIRFKSLFPQLTQGGTEDPQVYLDCNGKYHAIFNNQSPYWEIPVCGGHAYSDDGINWVYTGFAFGNFVQYKDGTNFTFSRRERPHFIFGPDQCTPIALTNGAQYGGRYGDATETSLQPLKK